MATACRADEAEALARATTTLEASFDPANRRRVRELQSRIVVPDEPRRLEAPTTQMLNSVRVTYQRAVEPLGFVCRGHSWWLVAGCRLRGHAIGAGASTSELFGAHAGASFTDIVARDRHRQPRIGPTHSAWCFTWAVGRSSTSRRARWPSRGSPKPAMGDWTALHSRRE
jgi:hypothetical protein